ncbi:MAG: glycosyltransferase family 2 protein [Microcoleus vaginatus WJT46-NPBG5]|jgi:glycosyltransferase involved in cell wall biosynthesis|nr:glycosyltransferase family 2 protein [Microcoleus vaginatus WJT46-NPBG5]
MSNSELPLVSVIIPAYHAEAFIEDTLNSVLSQTYKNIEVVVVDDGSQDRTAAIVRAIIQQDARVFLFQQSNAGVAAARNLGIQKSRGEYIAPIDADDIWYPQNLEKQVRCLLEAGPSVGVVYSWSLDIDEKGSLTGGFYTSDIEGDVYTALLYKYFLGNASSTLIRKACFDKVGGYNCKLKEQNAQGCEDRELYLRIAEFYQFRVVPEFLVGYRQIGNSMSCNDALMAKSHLLLLAEAQHRHPEIPAGIYQSSTSNFYLYLARQSSRGGKHASALNWLYQALQLDFIRTILDHNLYILSIQNLLKLIAQAGTSLVLPERPSRLQFKQQFNSDQRGMTLGDVTRRMNIHKYLPAQLYERSQLKKLSKSPEKLKGVSPQTVKPKTLEASLPPSAEG